MHSPPYFYIVCELRVSGECEDFSLLLCQMFVHVRPLAGDITLIL